jgi:hypothetical protein
VLTQRVRDHGLVLVKLACSSAEVLCHLSLTLAIVRFETWTERVKKRSTLR